MHKKQNCHAKPFLSCQVSLSFLPVLAAFFASLQCGDVKCQSLLCWWAVGCRRWNRRVRWTWRQCARNARGEFLTWKDDCKSPSGRRTRWKWACMTPRWKSLEGLSSDDVDDDAYLETFMKLTWWYALLCCSSLYRREIRYIYQRCMKHRNCAEDVAVQNTSWSCSFGLVIP